MRKPIILFPLLALTLLAGLSASAHHNPGYYFEMRVAVVHSDVTVVVIHGRQSARPAHLFNE